MDKGSGLASLWMGDIHPYMDENFIIESFKAMGETVQRVRIMRNKFSGSPLGYCFVHFADEKTANGAKIKLHGKPIPNSDPPINYKLNHANGGGMRGAGSGEKEFMLWVGDLTPDVDDAALYKAFATRYNSIKSVKVMLDTSQVSRGYAFIRFSTEDEHKDALAQMNGYRGVGGKALKVGLAVPKGKPLNQWSGQEGGDYSQYQQYFDPYWQNYSQWQNYGAFYDGSGYYGWNQQDYNSGASDNKSSQPHEDEYEDYRLIEYDIPLDVDKMNQDLIERSLEFWDALDNSRWLPPEAIDGLNNPTNHHRVPIKT